MVRKKVIQARISNEELALIEVYCSRTGISISDLIRSLVLDKAREYENAQAVGDREEVHEEEEEIEEAPEEPTLRTNKREVARVELYKLFQAPK